MKTNTQVFTLSRILFLLVLACSLLPLVLTSKQRAASAQVTITEFSDFRTILRTRDGGGALNVDAFNQGKDQPIVKRQHTQPSPTNATLSINDVNLVEDSCQNKNFVFTVTLSKLTAKVITVNYATSDGLPNQVGAPAVANKDYVPVAGTLAFKHNMSPNGPRGSYLLTITIPLGNYVVSSGAIDARSFTVTLSGATNATISKAQGVGTLLGAAASCAPAENAGCFVNYCGATRACRQVNRSACATPYPVLAGLGIAPQPDPDFATCNAAGFWKDTDGDSLSDAAESQEYIDVNFDGINDPSIDVQLPGADPNKADVYLHYDYVAAGDHDHNPPPRAIQLVVEAFAAHGVNLHIDPQHNVIDESSTKVVTLLANGPDYVPDPACAGPSAKSMHQLREQTNFGLRDLAYHYLVFSHYSSCASAQGCVRCAIDPECGGGTPPFFGSTGSAEINGDDVIVSLGPYTDASYPIPDETWAGVLMHELGHNFGLKHGGPDCDNFKPNYVSVMNYDFYTTGIPVGNAPGDNAAKLCLTDADCGSPSNCPEPDCEAPPHCSATTHLCYRIDYSSFQYNDLFEATLDETIGLFGRPSSRDLTVWTTDGVNTFYGPTNGARLDWNQNGIIESQAPQDINSDGSMTLLAASNDWARQNSLFTNLNFAFQAASSFGNDGGSTLAVKDGFSRLTFLAGASSPRKPSAP